MNEKEKIEEIPELKIEEENEKIDYFYHPDNIPKLSIGFIEPIGFFLDDDDWHSLGTGHLSVVFFSNDKEIIDKIEIWGAKKILKITKDFLSMVDANKNGNNEYFRNLYKIWKTIREKEKDTQNFPLLFDLILNMIIVQGLINGNTDATISDNWMTIEYNDKNIIKIYMLTISSHNFKIEDCEEVLLNNEIKMLYFN